MDNNKLYIDIKPGLDCWNFFFCLPVSFSTPIKEKGKDLSFPVKRDLGDSTHLVF